MNSLEGGREGGREEEDKWRGGRLKNRNHFVYNIFL